MTHPHRHYVSYYGVLSHMRSSERGFIRLAFVALVVMVILSLIVDATLSPLQPPAPKPMPSTHPYYKDLGWETVALYYLLGFAFYAIVALLALIQEGTLQRKWFNWRWSLWQRYGQAAFVGEVRAGWLARRFARLFDMSQARLDTFYQWLAEANAAFEEGRLEAAVETYRKAMILRPGSVVARVNLGAALGRLGRHAEALEAFRHVLEADGTNGDACKNAAVALVQLGRAAEAEALLAPHLATHGRDAEGWWLSARCRAANPEANAASVAEALELACRLEPARRAAIAAEPAFAPHLSHPSISALLPPEPKREAGGAPPSLQSASG